MKNIVTKAIVIKSINFFEKDRLLTVFSEDLGKCKILVKSANSPKFK